MKKNYFITVEGIEGAGKSTAILYIQELLRKAQCDFVQTREPGGTPVADEIRRMLLSHHEEPVCPDTELLLMFASRAQNIARVIKPALDAGKWVLCDRFTDASYAYQGGGRYIPEERIATLEQWVQGNLRPDLILLFDIAPELGISRIKERKTKDRIEHETLAFFERVRNAYLKRAQAYPKRYAIINANCDIDAVKQQISAILHPLLFQE